MRQSFRFVSLRKLSDAECIAIMDKDIGPFARSIKRAKKATEKIRIARQTIATISAISKVDFLFFGKEPIGAIEYKLSTNPKRPHFHLSRIEVKMPFGIAREFAKQFGKKTTPAHEMLKRAIKKSVPKTIGYTMLSDYGIRMVKRIFEKTTGRTGKGKPDHFMLDQIRKNALRRRK